MDANRISVARVLELGVPLTWQEAVAVTQEVAIVSVVNTTMKGRASKVDADVCFLTRRGDVELPVAAASERPDAVQQFLRALLAGRETPADLEALAYGPSVRNLGDELAPFSRPNRRAEIAALAQRGLTAETEFLAGAAPRPAPAPTPASTAPVEPPSEPPTPRALNTPREEDEVDRLRSQVASRAETAESPEAGARRRKAGVDPKVAAVLGALLVVGGTAAWWLRPKPAVAAVTEVPAAAVPGEPMAAQPSAAESPAPAAEAEAEAIVSQPGDIELGRSRSPAAGAGRAVGATAAPTATGIPPTSPTPSAAATVVTPEPAPAGDATSIEAATSAAFESDSVYSWADKAVEPPAMTYPRMPRAAFPPGGDAVNGAYVEVLVGETGGVEAVRLRGQAAAGENIYRHRMILAAAKAWEFTPARLDGRPVRYVVRVVLAP